jgi:hypothetical protein
MRELPFQLFTTLLHTCYHAQSRQNSVKHQLVKLFTTVLFDVEIRLQDH